VNERLSADDKALVARYEAAGQGHVFRFLPRLSDVERGSLLAQARGIDVDVVAGLAALHDPSAKTGAVEPPGDELLPLASALAGRADAHARGVEELRAGRVAVVVAAGGQGTRLGSTAPKGLWPVGPTSGKTLFQWHGDKVAFWAREIRRPIPFVVMVSEATQRATEDALRWYGHFGLDASWVRTPCQGSLPPLDDAGRMLLETPSRIARSPNGHGGLFAALVSSKLLDLFEDHGVRTLAYVQIDNPLIRTVDPAFIGFHVGRGSRISSKSVAKRDASEKVGVFARVGGRPSIVEYTELTDAQSRASAADGSLVFGQANIAAHCVDVAFARRIAAEGLPVHRARKKVPFVDVDGRVVSPEKPNATKFESFLFDAIPRAERSLVVETTRAEEFSPIKQNEGVDSPETARADLIAMFRGWHERAGLPCPDGAVEVDPSKAPDETVFRRLHGLAPA
jgi:UDP-N-acetylglucosamine/UDP-N-acetylgalactosamine diphosphorylase